MADLQQALEDYLPVLLGLVRDGKSMISVDWFELSIFKSSPNCYFPYFAGSSLQHKVQFVWVNQEDDAEVRI